MAGTAGRAEETHIPGDAGTKTLVSKIIYISVFKKRKAKKEKRFRISTIQKSVFPPNSSTLNDKKKKRQALSSDITYLNSYSPTGAGSLIPFSLENKQRSCKW